MAERRMFAKSIVLSDAFLDMPLSARCLYFTLNMLADDDGFVNNPKSIMRQCGASEDDLSILLVRKFLLAFESGVIVIKHWKVHNYIQKDRYKETKYIEEKSLLELDKRSIYRKKEECIQNVYSLDTQVRLGKDRLELGKDSLGKDISFFYNDENSEILEIEKKEEKKTPKKMDPYINPINEFFACEYQKIFNTKPYLLNNQRNKLIELASEIDDFKETVPVVLDKLKNIDFDLPNFTANYLWLLKDDNYLKVLSGTYDVKKTAIEKEIENYEVDEYGN